MTEFRVPPGCTGLTMEKGGSRFDASRSGRVTVDDNAAAAQIRKASAASNGMVSEVVYGGAVGGPSRKCGTCGFIGYLWQSGCPKGHGPMPLRTPEREPEPAEGAAL